MNACVWFVIQAVHSHWPDLSDRNCWLELPLQQLLLLTVSDSAPLSLCSAGCWPQSSVGGELPGEQVVEEGEGEG